MRMHDNVHEPRVVASRHLAIRNQVSVARLASEHAGKSFASALPKVNPHVVRQWSLPVCAFNVGEQFVNLGEVDGIEIPSDVDAWHGQRLRPRPG